MKTKLIRVSDEFAAMIRKEARMHDKKMVDITRELANKLKSKKNFNNEVIF